MKLRVSTFVRPDSNSWYVVAAVSVTVMILAYSTLFGQISILAMYALWFPLVVIGHKSVLQGYRSFLFIFALPGLAFLSTFWSDYPPVTLRASIQYLTMVTCAVIAARVCSLRDFARGMVLGVTMVLLYSLAFGHYAFDYMDQSYAFAGLFGSKNQVGLYASVGIYFAYITWIARRDTRLVRLAMLAASLLFVYCLWISKSATSIITLFGAVVAVSVLHLIARLPTRFRRAAIVMAFAVLPAVMALAYLANVDALVLGAFGKDSTLTGRTYLWSEGIRFGSEVPTFGLGYQAFWVQGRVDAERLWHEFYIGTRSGFHFHNVYIETFVELGFAGLGVLIALLGKCLLQSFVAMQDAVTRRLATVLFGLLFLLIARSPAEVDFLGPYGIGAFLLFAQAAYLTGRELNPRIVADARPQAVPAGGAGAA